MQRTTGRTLIYLAGVPFAAIASPGFAAEEDTQLWTSITLVHALGDGLDGSLELSPRFRGNAAGGEQFVTRALIDYRLTPAITPGASIAYIEYGGGREFRAHQQVNIAAGRLSFRTRVEERFFDGADRMELRLRQRVQMTFPLDADTALAASGEVLGIVRPRSKGGDKRIEQWRASLTARRNLAPGLSGGLGYLLIVAPRKGRPDRISHVPQVTIAWRI